MLCLFGFCSDIVNDMYSKYYFENYYDKFQILLEFFDVVVQDYWVLFCWFLISFLIIGIFLIILFKSRKVYFFIEYVGVGYIKQG